MSACIVCGVDGSPEAARAAAVAARLARALGSRVVLVHADEDERPRRGPRIPRPARAWRSRKLLRATQAEYRFGPRTRTLLKRGDPARELLAAAREEDAELIVVSTGGVGTVSPVLIGGTAAALMRRAHCPVVTVPAHWVPPLDPGGLHAVVCAVEQRPSDAAVLGLAADLAARLDGVLHAVASEPHLDITGLAVEAHVHTLDMPRDEALTLVAEAEHAGLVVVGPLDEIHPRQVVDVPLPIALAARGDTPVIVLPAEAKLHFGSGYYELAPADGQGPARAT